MRIIKTLLIIISTLLLFACIGAIGATANSQKMNELNVGMTKKEVIDRLGNPYSTSGAGATQFLRYALYPTNYNARNEIPVVYFVRLVNGKVDSYGRFGDFDSAKVPETNSTVNLNIKRK